MMPGPPTRLPGCLSSTNVTQLNDYHWQASLGTLSLSQCSHCGTAKCRGIRVVALLQGRLTSADSPPSQRPASAAPEPVSHGDGPLAPAGGPCSSSDCGQLSVGPGA